MVPYWLALALVAATGVTAAVLPVGREGSLSRSLESLPGALGTWRETSGHKWQAPEPPAGATETLYRVYDNGHATPVSLFIAYWKRQGPGEVAFTAAHAAPGRDWTFVREDLARLPGVSPWGETLTVTRTLYEHRGARQLVSYWWVQPQRRTVGQRYWGRAWVLWDYVTGARTDVALVRVATPVAGQDPGTSFERQEAFVRAAVPAVAQVFER